MHVSEQNLNLYTCYKLKNEQIHINIIMFYTEINNVLFVMDIAGIRREVTVPETLNDSHAQRLKFLCHERHALYTKEGYYILIHC